MTHFRILSICLICLSVAACKTQEQTAAVKKTTDIKSVTETTANQNPTKIKIRPAINLSIDNMPVQHQVNDDNFLNTGNQPTEKNTTLFETLSKSRIEKKINLNGKLLTDEEKIENKAYLDSVKGMQINIEGSFN